MSNAITSNTQQFTSAYLTNTEFKNAPTAIDYDNLVVGGDAAAQEAELTNQILRASSWADQFCNQVLGATLDTETQRGRIKGDGTIRLHPSYNPVIALTKFSYGTDFLNMVTAQDCSMAWIEDSEIIFPYASLSQTFSSQGPLSFGFPSTPRAEVFMKYTYVNGYANTTIVTATAGQSTLTVANGIGIVAGQMLKIYDGSNSENVTVASNYVFGSNTVPLTAPLLYNHIHNESISAMPAAIKQAVILATTAFLKIRGDNSLVMAVSTRGSEAVQGDQKIASELRLAEELLKPFRRIR